MIIGGVAAEENNPVLKQINFDNLCGSDNATSEECGWLDGEEQYWDNNEDSGAGNEYRWWLKIDKIELAVWISWGVDVVGATITMPQSGITYDASIEYGVGTANDTIVTFAGADEFIPVFDPPFCTDED